MATSYLSYEKLLAQFQTIADLNRQRGAHDQTGWGLREKDGGETSFGCLSSEWRMVWTMEYINQNAAEICKKAGQENVLFFHGRNLMTGKHEADYLDISEHDILRQDSEEVAVELVRH